MAVYVDALCVWGGADAPPCFRHKPSCHMYADTPEELHEMADAIGLKRSWFQCRIDLPHYDLTAGKRRLAVTRGAIETDRRHLAAFMRTRRASKCISPC